MSWRMNRYKERPAARNKAGRIAWDLLAAEARPRTIVTLWYAPEMEAWNAYLSDGSYIEEDVLSVRDRVNNPHKYVTPDRPPEPRAALEDASMVTYLRSHNKRLKYHVMKNGAFRGWCGENLAGGSQEPFFASAIPVGDRCMKPGCREAWPRADITCSPYALAQERVSRDLHYPWRVIVCCALLNQTQGEQVRPMLDELFIRCPQPELMMTARLSDLLQPLGLQDRRERLLRRMTWDYTTGAQPGECFGVGQYGRDALLLFVHDVRPVGVRDPWLQKWRGWRYDHCIKGHPILWDRKEHAAWRAASGFEPLRQVW